MAGLAPFLPATNRETVYRGDTRTWQDVLEHNTGTDDAPVWEPIDLTDWTFLAQIRLTPDDETIMASVTVEVVGDPANGTITRTLTATEARKLVPGRVYFDMQATHADGTERTYLAGQWTVLGDVSRADA